MAEQKLQCSLCQSEVQTAKAMVPAIQALRQVLNRDIKVEDLKEHAFCRKCAPASRGIVKLYSYEGTAAELERRRKEREQGKAFFSMRYSLKAAGIGK